MDQFRIAVKLMQFHDLILVKLNGSGEIANVAAISLAEWPSDQELQDFALAGVRPTFGLCLSHRSLFCALSTSLVKAA